MEIRYRDIILRDMRESDIDDWIRWYNVETEWANWDAPDEELEPVDPDKFRAERMETLNYPWENDFRNFFELDTVEGHHIGMVTSYAIGEDFQWMSWKDAHENVHFSHTVGIDICDSRFWGRGYGTQALAAFVQHFLDSGISDICLQTWSGNLRMIHVAEKLGFEECNRFVGNRQIRGGVYDSLTFKLNLDRFHNYLKQNT